VKRWAIVIGCAALLGATACEKEEPTPEPTVEETPVPAPAPTPAAAATAPQPGADLPVEQDFEEEAAQEISPENLEGELVKLEKEINEKK
jgi:hypothetical protein